MPELEPSENRGPDCEPSPPSPKPEGEPRFYLKVSRGYGSAGGNNSRPVTDYTILDTFYNRQEIITTTRRSVVEKLLPLLNADRWDDARAYLTKLGTARRSSAKSRALYGPRRR